MERIGVMFDRAGRPEDLTSYAAAVEAAGADDLWVVEDLSWAGGISSAALALAATERLRVGIGIMPAPLRNPALLAMEVATLARVFPCRVVAGVGHGVGAWMEGVGAGSPTKLALLGETITALRTLLAGETLRLAGRTVRVDDLRLVHPPSEPPPVVAGVVRPRSLALSGEVADGTVLAEGNGPAGVATALTHIAPARPHEVIVFTHLCVSDDPARLAATAGPVMEEAAGFLGIPPGDAFLASGDAETAADRVRALWRAGATTVVLRPVGEDPLDQVRAVLGALRP